MVTHLQLPSQRSGWLKMQMPDEARTRQLPGDMGHSKSMPPLQRLQGPASLSPGALCTLPDFEISPFEVLNAFLAFQGIKDFPRLFWPYPQERTGIFVIVREVVLTWFLSMGSSLILAQSSDTYCRLGVEVGEGGPVGASDPPFKAPGD